MLAVLQECHTVEECRQQIPSVLNLLMTALDQLSSGQVPFEELVVNRRLSQDPLTYEKANISAIASQQLLSRGIKLAPGERIQLVYLNATSRIPAEKVRAYSLLDGNCNYDVDKYSELLLQATEALLLHFGWSTKKLADALGRRKSGTVRGKRSLLGGSRTLHFGIG
jgi:DNA polymerase elongation subunit (family B)